MRKGFGFKGVNLAHFCYLDPHPAVANVEPGWNQGPVPQERAKTRGKSWTKEISLFFREGMRGSEGFCLNKGTSLAMIEERLLPCFGPEEEPDPDSQNSSAYSSENDVEISITI